MKLEIGSELRFAEFIGDMDENDRVALVSHTDLDGIASAFVAEKIVGADLIKFVSYGDMNEDLVAELKEEGITKIIFTDLYISDDDFVRGLEKFADVMILDHHPTMKDWNSEKTVFIKVEDGYCAAYLCYELFGKARDIEQWDWLVACACISDFCHVKVAEWLSGIFEKNGDYFEMVGRGVRQSGAFWDLQYTLSLALIYFRDDLKRVYDSIGENFGDIGDLDSYAKKVDDEINDSVLKFEKEKQNFSGGFLWVFNPHFKIGSIVSNIISTKYSDKTVLILRDDGQNYSISARRQDKKEDMNELLNNLILGFEESNAGGHVAASGGAFPKKYIGEFKKRLGIKT